MSLGASKPNRISKTSATYTCGRIIGPVISVSITGSITLATGGLLVLEGIIGPVVSVSITGSITLATGGLLVPEGIICLNQIGYLKSALPIPVVGEPLLLITIPSFRNSKFQ
jgi:hypothetical protein